LNPALRRETVGRIAFVRIDGRNNPEIYVMNADGSQQVRLTRHRGDDVAPDWQKRPEG
jgi:Tol biopolymer transport system component